ncbi:MAG TPA: hypothetical protein VGB17_08240 [Pyrinomonadaceae bacterium]
MSMRQAFAAFLPRLSHESYPSADGYFPPQHILHKGETSMLHIIRRDSIPAGLRPFLFLAALACLSLCAGLQAAAQHPQGAGKENEPVFSEFKGVRIGMPAAEVRQKLGEPRDKGDEQDFFVINDTHTVQVVYDKTSHKVLTISADYMGGASDAPKPKDIFGTDLEAQTDGSIHKLVRYPKAGFWVSYSRTAGEPALVSVTLQKIQ